MSTKEKLQHMKQGNIAARTLELKVSETRPSFVVTATAYYDNNSSGTKSNSHPVRQRGEPECQTLKPTIRASQHPRLQSANTPRGTELGHSQIRVCCKCAFLDWRRLVLASRCAISLHAWLLHSSSCWCET